MKGREMTVSDQTEYARISTGTAGFDDLVEGGLIEDRLYILSGPPGSGKTTFSAQFITEGARQGENSLFMSMHENRAELVHDMSSYDFGFDRAVESNRVKFLNIFDDQTKNLLSSPRENDYPSGVDRLVNKLTSFVESRDIERMVIDSTMLLEYLFPNDEDVAMQFLAALKQVDVTTLLISEMRDPTSYTEEQYLAHGVFFLHNYLESSSMTRGMQVIKMRGTSIDCDIYEASFSDSGITVHSDRKVKS